MNAPVRPSIESRRAPRDLVSFRARLEGHSALRGQLLLVDISPLGFMARTPATFEAGEAVTVRMPVLGAVAARVVWSIAGRIGAEFERPIADADYRRLLAKAPHEVAGYDGI